MQLNIKNECKGTALEFQEKSQWFLKRLKKYIVRNST